MVLSKKTFIFAVSKNTTKIMPKDHNTQTIQDLLKGRNADFDASKKVKLVRHSSTHIVFGMPYSGTVYDLYNDRPLFIDYQRHQKRANFEDVEYIVSFISEKGTDSLFVGVFRNLGETLEPSSKPNECYFDFQEVPGFEDIKEKVIIKWHNPRVWHQWYNNLMEVVPNSSKIDLLDVTKFQQSHLNTDNRIKHTAESTTEVEARHQKMQEGLKKCLEAEGYTNIIMEADHIDLQATKNGESHFFEVKTHDTARACIREALGQILEYNHFPNTQRADKMFIVGPAKPTKEELQYIKFLQKHYNLIIEYRCYYK